MFKKELFREIAKRLKDEDMKKLVPYPKTKFHISDDNGNHKDFVVYAGENRVMYTYEDVSAIMEMAMNVIIECVRNGDPVSISGFGTFGHRYLRGKDHINVTTGQVEYIEGHYVSKFSFGKDYKLAVALFDKDVRDGIIKVSNTKNVFANEENILSTDIDDSAEGEDNEEDIEPIEV